MFDQLGLDEKIIKAISELGFEQPMPVQEQVIPYILANTGKDLIALAQTGTGKTAAFGLPIIQKTKTNKKHTQSLILCPTRELCLQVADDISDYAKYLPELKVAAVFGGASIERQIMAIKKGAHVISATPGRLVDLINRGEIDLSKVENVVLDEADEMLNMGFRDELEAILEKTPTAKNTYLFSATMPNEIRQIAKKYMHDFQEITIGRKNAGAENVEHQCFLVHAKDRYLALKRIVDFNPDIYGIVFCRTRNETQEVADLLIKDGYNAEALHGDLSQSQRNYVMQKFRIRHLRLLVATDVAARGLDVNELTHVINYNLPDELEIYTHRSGRTGRAGKKGISVVIANLKEKNKLRSIEKQINKTFTFAPVPLGKDVCEKQLFHLIDKVEKVEINDAQIETYLPKIFKKLEWLDRDEIIKKFVSLEFNRFLDYYKNAPDLSVSDDKKSGDRKSDKKKDTRGLGMTRFFINLGKKDRIRPTDLIDLVVDITKKRNVEIGDIEILSNFSFIEIESEYEDQMLKGFKGKVVNDRELNIEVSESKGKSGSDRSSRKSGRSDSGDRRGYKSSHDDDRRRDRSSSRDDDRRRDRSSSRDDDRKSYRSGSRDDDRRRDRSSSRDDDRKSYRSDSRDDDRKKKSYGESRNDDGGRKLKSYGKEDSPRRDKREKSSSRIERRK